MMARTVFLSAVSTQFRDCRLGLASDLRAQGYLVRTQDDFQTDQNRTLLEKLEAFIEECDLVIAAVGDAFGFGPDHPEDQLPRSYTQWEYYLAVGERLDGSKAAPRPLLLYFAADEYLHAHPAPASQTEEQTASQVEFRALIRASGKDRGAKFDSCLAFRHQVLRDLGLAPETAHKPNNIQFPSLGTLFKGRDAFLADLRRRFSSSTESQPRAIVPHRAVHGLGGVGKTRVAIEYAWKFQGEYSALLFVSASSATDLRTKLADLVGVLAIKTPVTDIEVRLQEVLRWLDTHPGWLLILDNIDTDETALEAERLLARLTAGHVLITTRLTNWSAGVDLLELDLLSEADAVAFLLERTRQRRRMPDDDAKASTIARELDGLALALEQAGAYIDRNRLSLFDYLNRWQSKRAEVLAWHDERLMGYPASVAITWATSFAQIGEESQTLLRILSWLAPDPIPLWFFDADSLASTLSDPRDHLANLAAYSLVQFATEDDSVKVHRLVQQVTRNRASDPERDSSLRAALETMSILCTDEPDDVRTWGILTPLSPHLEVVVQHGDGARIDSPTSQIMNQYALYLRARGQYRAAEPLFRRALVIVEASLGPDHPIFVRALNNLASLFQDTNRLFEAEPLFRRALAIDEASLGPDHPKLAIRLNNLAWLLYATNRLVDAELLYHRALAIGEASLGLDHPYIAAILNNLALLLQAKNRLVDAEPLFHRALKIDTMFFGPDHPNVAIDINNLALLLQANNRLVDAEELFHRALAIDEASLGPDHPNVAIRLNNLALLLGATNRLHQAEPLFRRALAIDEASFGLDVPNVARDLNNLAKLLQATNRLVEAELLFRRAVQILLGFRRQTGYSHPNQDTVLANYEGILKALNRTREEIEAAFQTLGIDAFGSSG